LSKKILHIIDQSYYAGVTTYAVRIIKYLPQYDHQILSCYKGNAIEEIKGMNISYEDLLNTGSVSIKYLLLKYFKIIFYLRKNEFDIIHYHQGGIGIILFAVLFGNKAKVVHHLHSGNLIGDNTKQDISFLHLFLLRFISRYTYQIAVANHVYDEYKLKIKRTKNLHLIENGVPFLFRTKNERENTVGFIGRFTKEKGFYTNLSISSQLASYKPDINIHAMGGVINNPEDNVKITPASFSVDQFYKNIDLLLFTSTAPESLPLVVLEAISFDVGVIAYPLKGIVEILGGNYPLYINNPADAISKIEYFYSDNFDRQKLSDIHMRRSHIFNFDEMIEKVNSLYNIILTKN